MSFRIQDPDPDPQTQYVAQTWQVARQQTTLTTASSRQRPDRFEIVNKVANYSKLKRLEIYVRFGVLSEIIEVEVFVCRHLHAT